METSQLMGSILSKRIATDARRAGFTLVELLTVLALMAILTALAIPAATALQTSGSLNQASSDMAATFESARAYAMGENTYVYVGLQEVNQAAPSAADGIGRIVVTAIASTDGTQPGISLWGTPALAAGVTPIQKPEIFQNLHLATAALLDNGPNMTARPSGALVTDLGSVAAATTFQIPLTGTAQNNFTRVVEFDPHGVARVQSGQSYDAGISSYIEVPLLPTHGGNLPTSTANQTAIQIDGVTGDVRIYRP